jgi:hypothetical protein
MNCIIKKLNKASARILNESYRRYQTKYILMDCKQYVYILNFFYIPLRRRFQQQIYVA